MIKNETNIQNEFLVENNAEHQPDNEINQKISEAENKLNKINQELKEKQMINIFNKYQIKQEFHDFLKFKTKDTKSEKIENTIKQFIKEQPVLRIPLNTGGNQQTIINNQISTKINPLLDYKKKNYL
ncbi:hypothetical protein [Spiroplasma endosymbiont of Nebria brevicollis]|uniref:hypothetical protein n=1 Tax=Spiroplasma endosymbiont of Nebria brevicollis TaxID=3066284 RepID=UPI00313B6ED2